MKFEKPQIEVIDIGDRVICDWCNKEWTGRPESGGVLFGSKACCPDCAPDVEDSARRYGEEQYIRGRCPEGVSFADWCLQLRGGNNTITIVSERKVDDE